MPKAIGPAGLALWFAGMLVIGASLLARHLITLPKPAPDRLTPSIAALREPTEGNAWLAVHVLYTSCRCSKKIAEHLTATDRPRPADLVEIVLLVGDDADLESRLRDHHFRIRKTTASELASFGIEAAPLFIVADPQGSVRYSGGYTDRKQGLEQRDLEIVKNVRAGNAAESIPVYGCAVSKELQKNLNPLGIP